MVLRVEVMAWTDTVVVYMEEMNGFEGKNRVKPIDWVFAMIENSISKMSFRVLVWKTITF